MIAGGLKTNTPHATKPLTRKQTSSPLDMPSSGIPPSPSPRDANWQTREMQIRGSTICPQSTPWTETAVVPSGRAICSNDGVTTAPGRADDGDGAGRAVSRATSLSPQLARGVTSRHGARRVVTSSCCRDLTPVTRQMSGPLSGPMSR